MVARPSINWKKQHEEKFPGLRKFMNRPTLKDAAQVAGKGHKMKGAKVKDTKQKGHVEAGQLNGVTPTALRTSWPGRGS